MICSLLTRSLFTIMLASFLATAAAAQQSLGEAARQARKNKPAEPTTKVITNDDLGPTRSSQMSDSADSSAENSGGGDHQAQPPQSGDGDKAKSDEEKAKTAEEKAKTQEEKAKEQKDLQDKTAKLQNEIETLQEQIRQRASNSYGDAGTRLRDPKKYADDMQHDKDQITAKQKELEDAKTKLGQLEDESRKSDQ